VQETKGVLPVCLYSFLQLPASDQTTFVVLQPWSRQRHRYSVSG
jgi:hypothetical protein